jgi:hypothetical protein
MPPRFSDLLTPNLDRKIVALAGSTRKDEIPSYFQPLKIIMVCANLRTFCRPPFTRDNRFYQESSCPEKRGRLTGLSPTSYMPLKVLF